MGFILSKLATQLVYPLSLSLLLSAAGLVLLWRRRRIPACVAFGLSLAILWLSSTQVVAVALGISLERQFPPVAIADLPAAEAIVVLGGGIRMPVPPELWSDLDDGADRVLHAARLYRAGKAPRVVATGGAMPWSRSEILPADGMAALLEEWGVPRRAILTEGRSRNTYENAVNTREVLERHQIGEVLLVTSAMHMPRALAVFRSAGIRAVPAATDYQVLHGLSGTWMSWLPGVNNLAFTHHALKERLGMLVYRTRGWIDD